MLQRNREVGVSCQKTVHQLPYMELRCQPEQRRRRENKLPAPALAQLEKEWREKQKGNVHGQNIQQRRTVQQQDRRSRTIALTQAGKAAAAKARPRWAAAQRRFESTFGREAALELRTVLKEVATAEFD